MSYPRYRGDGAVIDRPDQSIPIADGGARSSWMACWNNPLMEPFDAIVAIPMTRELRHKRLHIATVVKASRGRHGPRCDGSANDHSPCPTRSGKASTAPTSTPDATKQNAHSKVGVAVEAGASVFRGCGGSLGYEPTYPFD